MKEVKKISDDIQTFDRTLADSVSLLIESQDKNIYAAVLDKFAKGEEKLNDAEELKTAIDNVQVQIQKKSSEITIIENEIDKLVRDIDYHRM